MLQGYMLDRQKYDLRIAKQRPRLSEGFINSKLPLKWEGRPLSPHSVVAFNNGSTMVNNVLKNGRRMASHPYVRKSPPVKSRPRSCSSLSVHKRCFDDLAKRGPLKGLLPDQGKTSLPPEDIARIQNLIDPRFSLLDGNRAPKPFIDCFASESDRKRKILEYLHDEITTFKKEDESDAGQMELAHIDVDPNTEILDNAFAASQDLPASELMISDYPVATIPEVQQEFHSSTLTFEEAASPLSKLEEMKRLLPAIEAQDLTIAPVVPCSPGSPTSSVSSCSSRELDKGSTTKKQVAAYKGVGQMLLWQFLVHSLANGEDGIAWVNQEAYEFKFTRTDAIARAWGQCKNNSNMTYEKMCRGLRGYYKKILCKVKDHRDVFKFTNADVQRLCREMQDVTGGGSGEMVA